MGNKKRGQITVFIIIGIIILIAIGTAVYLYGKKPTAEYEAVRPQITKLPLQAQPVRDMIEACILQLGTEGLKKIGDSGGYVDSTKLIVNTVSPTEGEAVQLSPGSPPNIAYWWHMKSDNECKQNCQFETKRPPLYRAQGTNSIETQLDNYLTENLKNCLGNFESLQGCTVQELGEPKVTATVAEEDVFFTGTYPLRAICDGSTIDIEDSYVSIPIKLKEIYELATELANYQINLSILEQTTKTIITTFSGEDRQKLPPVRAFEIGPPKPGQYWIKMEVKEKIKELLAQYIPIIQVSSVRNYNYIGAPEGTRDPELYELLYNRQFLIPLNKTHPSLEARFLYFDWWQPYFDLNCNGQLCQADSASNFKLISFAMNRYNFAYDLSYPVMVELREPNAFNKQGYSFKFMLEQNMRDSTAFTTRTKPLLIPEPETTPSIFCDPRQKTSKNITITTRDSNTLDPVNEATISYICGNNNCNMGLTDKGKLTTQYPRCIGGTLRITKQGYATYSKPLDVLGEEEINATAMLDKIRTYNVTIKNYALTKTSKHGQWAYIQTLALKPTGNQTTTIIMTKNATPYEETFIAVTEIKGDEKAEITLVPGDYKVSIMSFLKENLTIPRDRRCTKPTKLAGITITGEECYFIPDNPIIFNETSPFPYGEANYNVKITQEMLRGKTNIEFKQFVIAIDKLDEQDRIVEDLEQISKIKMYAEANKDRLYPVIS